MEILKTLKTQLNEWLYIKNKPSLKHIFRYSLGLLGSPFKSAKSLEELSFLNCSCNNILKIFKRNFKDLEKINKDQFVRFTNSFDKRKKIIEIVDATLIKRTGKNIVDSKTFFDSSDQ